MLSGVYVGLRFVHFISLMTAFGCALYGAWWAPVSLRRLLMQRFYPLLRYLLMISAISATLMLMAQGGLMGDGWNDVWQPTIWRAVIGTQFGGVWLWQVVLAWIALAVAWIKPRRPARLLLLLFCAQLLLMLAWGMRRCMMVGLAHYSAPITRYICFASRRGPAGCCHLSTACDWRAGAGVR